GAVVGLVGVPPAGARVVFAGDVAGVVLQVFVIEIHAGVDDADLAVAGVRVRQLVGLDQLDAVRDLLAGGVRGAGRGRGQRERLAPERKGRGPAGYGLREGISDSSVFSP